MAVSFNSLDDFLSHLRGIELADNVKYVFIRSTKSFGNEGMMTVSSVCITIITAFIIIFTVLFIIIVHYLHYFCGIFTAALFCAYSFVSVFVIFYNYSCFVRINK